MTTKMSQVPVNRVFLDIRTPDVADRYEFTIDCGAVYFGAVYDDEGSLMFVDQYFFTEDFSRDDMEDGIDTKDLLYVDNRDYPTKTYMLTKEEQGNEWLRFHAVVPEEINPDYFYSKYMGE